MNAGLAEAVSGRGALFVIVGEAGIGKSRLADEFADQALDRGVRVAWGRCWEAGGAPAYWPWVQSLRSLVRDQRPATLQRQLGRGAAHVAQIIPELRAVVPDDARTVSADDVDARFLLFDAVSMFLGNASKRRPIVIILDDLHVADVPSLLMLRFVANELDSKRAMMVGTYRDDDVATLDDRAAVLADLGRIPATRRIVLSGLSATAVAMLAQSVGRHPSPASLTRLHAETDGNPLFVTELMRLRSTETEIRDTAEDDRGDRMPPVVHDVIEQRLVRLSTHARSALGIASVLGRDFSVDALRRLSGVDAQDILGLLDEAIAARMLTPVPDTVGRLRFSHALVRDAVYEHLPTAQRIELHRRAGAVLETLYGSAVEAHLAELAHHFIAAAPGDATATAATYAQRAGDRAASLLAYEEAGRLYRAGLAVSDAAGAPDDRTRCDLLLSLGEAEMRSGETVAAQRHLLQATMASKALASPERLARAALAYGGTFAWGRAARDPHIETLLRDALDAVGSEDGSLRSRLLARLAGALRDQPAPEPRASLSREAVEMARRLGDGPALAYALEARVESIWFVDNARERLAIADELLELTRRLGDPEGGFDAHGKRYIALAELGDVRAAKTELVAMDGIANELRQPALLWHIHSFKTMEAIVEGRFDDAAESIRVAESFGARSQGDDALVAHLVQAFLLHEALGSLDEVLHEGLRTARSWVEDHPTRMLFRAVAARAATALDRRTDAVALFDTVARAGFAGVPPDNEYLFTMCLLSDVCAYLADEPTGAKLIELLAPHADRIAVDVPEGSLGAVVRALGVLSTLLGRLVEAEAYFHRALDVNASIGARPWVARTQREFAAMLTRRDAPGDRERASELLDAARRTASALRMTPLVHEIDAKVGAAPTPSTSSDAALAGVFRCEGDYWSIAYEGREFRLRDSRGLRYLATLLGDPDHEVLALELIAGSGRSDRLSAGHLEAQAALSVPSPGDPILDRQAKRAYRTRVAELRDEIEDAERLDHPERALRARDEMEAIANELARATGLAGRDRRTPSDVERARVSVTKAIKAAIRRIDAYSPSLGHHLSVAVRTGTFCAYAPDPRAPIGWQI